MQIKPSPTKLIEVVHQTTKLHRGRIGHNDETFLQRIYSEGLEKYLDRLAAVGFSGHKEVLDAGCGYGQWSLALASLNSAVSGCDISPLRIEFAQDLNRKLGVNNVDLQVSGIDELPYDDARFDAVFCYGVIFLTPWRKSLRELARVLKPGGTLYVNANGLGWYVFLWQEEHNKADDYDPKGLAARSFSDSLIYDRQGIYEPGMNLIIEPEAIKMELQQLGFIGIQTASEGCLQICQESTAPQPFFKGEYSGLTGVFEVVGKREG